MFFAILLSLALTKFSLAGGFHLTCGTEPASTEFGLYEVGDEVQATVIFPYGPQYAPAIGGIFTPSDLPILSERAALAKQMNIQTTFHWPKKKCVLGPGSKIECFGSEDIQDGRNGTKFSPFAVYTTRISEDGIAGKLEYLKITLSLYSDGKNVDLQMQYPAGDCTVGEKK